MRRPASSHTANGYIEITPPSPTTVSDDLDDVLGPRLATGDIDSSDMESPSHPPSPSASVSDERRSKFDSRLDHIWRSAHYAVGWTPHATWADEAVAAFPCLYPPSGAGTSPSSVARYWLRRFRGLGSRRALGVPVVAESDVDVEFNALPAPSPRGDPESCACTAVSAVLATLFFPRARRLGNMLVLDAARRTDEEGEEVVLPPLRRVVGPYWPMMAFVTYPLILGVSGMVLWRVFLKPEGGISGHVPLFLTWAAMTVSLVVALFFTACGDPGILVRVGNVASAERGACRWEERSLSYRPRRAAYDTDCGVVVEEFDHVCPWTGTAIGKKNMPAFQAFLCALFSTLALDVVLLTVLGTDMGEGAFSKSGM